MALLSIYRGTQAEVSERPVSDGALLFATDTKKIYLDNGSRRVEMSSLQDLSNYITSTQLSSAIGEEASARQKQDQLLEQAIDDKLGADDIVAGSNVQISHDDESGHITISATGIKDTNTTYTLSKSGSTITLTGSDGKKTTVTDTDTTYTLSSFGVTASAAELNYMDGVTNNVQTQLNGKAATSHSHSVASNTAAGFAPKLSGSTTQYLRGDGSWATPPDTNTTYSTFKGATSSAAGSVGLVPAPTTGAANRYLRSDGTWTVPPDTNTTYSAMKGATSSVAGSTGLVPAPAAGKQTSFLRGDGTWVVPANTTYSAGAGMALSGTTFSLASSGVTAGSYGPTANVTGTNGTTINVPQITVDAYGRVTSVVNRVYTSKDTDTNTTYSNMTGATTGAAGKAGLVPAPAAGSATRYLRSDGTWAVPPDTNTTYSAMKGATSSAAGTSGLVPAPSAGAATRYLRSDGTWQVPPDTNTTYTLSSFGITATAAELNYCDGVTSNIQTQLNGKLSTTGTAAAATKLATARTIALSGDVTGSASFNGTANATISAQIAANAVTANEIAAGAVGSSEIADNAVTAAEIATGAVGTTELASNAVTLAKLGSDVGTIAVQSSTPTDANVKLWIQI